MPAIWFRLIAVLDSRALRDFEFSSLVFSLSFFEFKKFSCNKFLISNKWVILYKYKQYLTLEMVLKMAQALTGKLTKRNPLGTNLL